jgi:hypothetical protein
MNRRKGLLTAGLAVALVAGGGTALAASTGPVSSTGVITGCYTNAAVNGSHAVVLQNGGTACPSGTSAVTWNEQGAQGPAGANGTSILTSSGVPSGTCTIGSSDVDLADGEVYTCTASAWVDTGSSIQGPVGTNGTNGASIMTSSGFPPSPCTNGDTDIDLATGEVYTCTASAWADTGHSIQGPQGPAGTGATVSSLASGNSNCPNGGASITDGSGDTAYACNGAAAVAYDTGDLTCTGSVGADVSCTLSDTTGPDDVSVLATTEASTDGSTITLGGINPVNGTSMLFEYDACRQVYQNGDIATVSCGLQQTYAPELGESFMLGPGLWYLNDTSVVNTPAAGAFQFVYDSLGADPNSAEVCDTTVGDGCDPIILSMQYVAITSS